MLANIPATQTVIEISKAGGPEVLVPATRPVPEPKAGEVLIRIAAGGVNRADCLQRMGRYPMPPWSAGHPRAGMLRHHRKARRRGHAVAGRRSGLRADDRRRLRRVPAVPAVQCLPVSQDVDLIDAGGLPETFCTVWTNVFDRMHLQPGETFLIQGGSSGIGVTSIQLAKAWGCRGIATAGSDAREMRCLPRVRRRCRDQLSHAGFCRGGQGVHRRARRRCDPRHGRRPLHPREIELLAHEGRLCFVALMGGTLVEADFGAIQRKHLTVTGSTLRSRGVVQKAAIIGALREKVWPMWAEHKLRPFTYRRFPLREAAEAHRLMKSSEHIGKILLVP